MTTSARAVVSERGRLSVIDVEVRDPLPGEVLVEVKASGVCHTDYDVMQAPLRFVLGHEGASRLGATAAVTPAPDEQGDLLLDVMITHVYPLDDVQRALDDMLAGRGAKRVLVFE